MRQSLNKDPLSGGVSCFSFIILESYLCDTQIYGSKPHGSLYNDRYILTKYELENKAMLVKRKRSSIELTLAQSKTRLFQLVVL